MLSWNIAGWGNKDGDPDLMNFFKDFELILLQETWSTRDIKINGFTSYMKPALKTNMKGRPKAGFCCMIKDNLGFEIKQLEKCSPLAQALILTQKKDSLLLLNVYIPPTKNNSNSENWSQLTFYIENLTDKYPNASLIIAGDFNARVGTNNEQLCSKLNWNTDNDIAYALKIGRLSRDRVVNNEGLRLLELCNHFNLQIVNGSTKGDRSGEFTYFSPRGCSVIDYILVPYNIINSIMDLKIGTRTESDHQPLLLSINLKDESKITKYNIIQSSQYKQMTQLKWSQEMSAAVGQKLTANLRKQVLSNLKTTNLYSDIPKIYNAIFQMFVELSTPPKVWELKHSASPWFDDECFQLKRKLRQTFRNNRTKLEPSYIDEKRKYHNILAEKKQKYATQKWLQLLDSIQSKNNKAFWNLVYGGLKAENQLTLPPIAESKWSQYFTSVFNNLHSELKGNETPKNKINKLQEWPRVEEEEIREIVKNFKSGKSPGPDGLPIELFKTYIDWWAEPLAQLFTLIDKYGTIPEIWLRSIIIPIFKNGDPKEPRNYRPISLLSVIGKIYAKHLLSKLLTWMKNLNLPGKEQIGFSKGCSTLDHCLILMHLVEKYRSQRQSKIYAAFVDFRGAFDSIDRPKLWRKLAELKIDQRLLILMQNLHSSNTCQVKLNTKGHLSSDIPNLKGVKQGCILAPFLFNLFLSDLPDHLQKIESHAPKLNQKPVPLLLYADDAVLLSLTSLGLKRLLSSLILYCECNKLSINYEKTKILVFSNGWKLEKWKIRGQEIQQVKIHRYLGILFQSNLGWITHRTNAIKQAKCTSSAVARFYYQTGNQFIPAAIQIFQTKVQSQLLYGIPLWVQAYNSDLKKIHSSFLRRILGLPAVIKYETMCAEIGIHTLEYWAWSTSIKYWLRCHFRCPPSSLLADLLKDSYKSRWYQHLEKKIESLGIELEPLYNSNEQYIFHNILTRLKDVERQNIMAAVNKICSPTFYGLNILDSRANYVAKLIIPAQRRAFMLARLNVFPSAFVRGRYQNVPRNKRTCRCSMNVPDTVEHILFHCPLHSTIRQRVLPPLSGGLEPQQGKCVGLYLSDADQRVTAGVAEFLAAVLQGAG